MAEPKLTEKKWKKEIEQEITARWKKEQPYKVSKDSTKKHYVIDTPPPYINAPIHIGHATTYVMQDMFARFHRMLGEEVIFPLGLDRNGLPIEVAAEKKFKVRLHELPREEAVAYCKKILEMTSDASVKSFADLGCSFTSWEFETNEPGEAYKTDSPHYRALTQDTFIDLWKKDLVKFDTRINNYSPGLRTTIADSEIEYEDLPTKFVDVKWKVKETDEEIIIGTTRPELISSCGMVIYNPEDDRYKHLEGKTAITPIYGVEVPIKAHTDAQIDKGTGLVMMCSAGDNTDIRFFREQNIKPIISIDMSGLMNSNAGFLEGIHVKKARAQMIETLEEKGLVENIKDCTHRTPICERSKVPVEFIEMEEIYIKQKDFLGDIKKIADEISFFDPKSKQILLDWLDKINIDWPVSRRRFYATEIPLWYCKECNHAVVPEEKGKYWQPWKDPCPVDACPKCGHKEFEGETRVFDTWFDSSISPLFNMKYQRDMDFFNKIGTCSLRPQGKEIVRTWLYYTLLRGHLALEKPIFKDVWIHHHVVDDSGKKFSKSLGNGIDPQVIIRDYGAEAFRLWTVSEGNIHEGDLRCSMERIKGLGKTLTKILNIARFISTFEYDDSVDKKLLETDMWIMNEVNQIVEFAKKQYLAYDFHNPAKRIRNFIMEVFSSHYLELVKSRAYNENGIFTKEEQNGAVYTLNYVLKTLLKVWAPVLPILSEKLYNGLYGEDVHALEFPEVEKFETSIDTKQLLETNGAIWKFKKENQISLKEGISKATVPQELEAVAADLKVAHSLGELDFGTLSFEK